MRLLGAILSRVKLANAEAAHFSGKPLERCGCLKPCIYNETPGMAAKHHSDTPTYCLSSTSHFVGRKLVSGVSAVNLASAVWRCFIMNISVNKGSSSLSSYIASIRFSVLSFPLFALICTIPYMVYQYRKFGRIPFWKTFIVYMFFFYVTTAYYMVILPLPEDHTAVVAYAATPQLVPFNFVYEIVSEVHFSILDPRTWLQTLKCPDLYEAFFNLLLTVPLGIFLRYFFKCRWWQVLLIGFAMTLFYETSQLTGLWGIYLHPYRLFDVDDLMVNTLGAMVGFWVAKPLARHLPDIDELNEESKVESATYTTFTRRFVAFLIDLVPIAFVFDAIWLVGRESLNDLVFDLVVATVATGVFFIAVPILTKGATLGEKVLQLRIVRPDGSPAGRWQSGLRYLLLFWGFLLLPEWAYVLLPDSVEGSVLPPDMAFVAVVMFYGSWLVTVLIRAIRSAHRHPFVMINGMISHTRVMSIEQSEALRNAAAAAREAVADGAEAVETAAADTALRETAAADTATNANGTDAIAPSLDA